MNSLYRKLTVSVMMVSFLAPSWTYASEFFTIIGPDGRPMIVQKQSKKTIQPPTSSSQTLPRSSESVQVTNQVVEKNVKLQSALEDSKTVLDTQKNASLNTVQNTKNLVKNEQQASEQKKNNLKSKQSENTVQTPIISTENYEKVDVDKNPRTLNHPDVVPKNVTQPIEKVAKNIVSPLVKAEVSQIDGVEYINNEYLEDREFNLEGKKRFYVMPLYNDVQGGANAKIGHMETVEREKGVNKNFLNQMFNKEEKVEQPLILATTYYRISKENVEENLEQSCFTGKKVNKAKILGQKNTDIGLWPTAPLKDSFEYEIVQVEKNLKDVKVTSYAASQKKPVFYWPLVVFLDQKGCVIEGVGGFKNQDNSSTSLQYASIEGLIRLPEGTTYLFMTPLASAIDVEDKALTNHGQIKLSVLR